MVVGRILRVVARESSVKFSLCPCAPRHVEIKVRVQSKVKVGKELNCALSPKAVMKEGG